MINEAINFPEGIPGFENLTEFKLVREKDSPLAQLVSITEQNIGFILIPPEIFFPEYSIEIDEDSKEFLLINESSKVEVWTILTNHSDINKISINLRAPILVNLDKKIGCQMILLNDKYSTKQPLPVQKEMEGVAK